MIGGIAFGGGYVVTQQGVNARLAQQHAAAAALLARAQASVDAMRAADTAGLAQRGSQISSEPTTQPAPGLFDTLGQIGTAARLGATGGALTVLTGLSLGFIDFNDEAAEVFAEAGLSDKQIAVNTIIGNVNGGLLTSSVGGVFIGSGSRVLQGIGAGEQLVENGQDVYAVGHGLATGNLVEFGLGPLGVLGADLPGFRQADNLAPGGVATRHGVATQANSAEALLLRQEVASGRQVFRAGNFPNSATGEGQFFSPRNPLTTPDFANRVGAANLGKGTPDFVIGGRVRPGGPLVTRPAPRVGSNLGGDLEIVTPPGGVQIDFFHMP